MFCCTVHLQTYGNIQGKCPVWSIFSNYTSACNMSSTKSIRILLHSFLFFTCYLPFCKNYTICYSNHFLYRYINLYCYHTKVFFSIHWMYITTPRVQIMNICCVLYNFFYYRKLTCCHSVKTISRLLGLICNHITPSK